MNRQEIEDNKADLQGADLQGANLRGADLQGANLPHTCIVPEGDLLVWKACCQDVLVQLLIPRDARRSNATGRKCRAEYAIVKKVLGAEYGISQYDPTFLYREGETVYPHEWCADRWCECAGGIHFYLTKEECQT